MIRRISATKFGPKDLPYDSASMPWATIRPVICWFCKSISGADHCSSKYTLSVLYRKTCMRGFEQGLGSLFHVECSTLVPIMPSEAVMCEEMLENNTGFVPEYAGEVVSEFNSEYVMRSITRRSIDIPHGDFFYWGYVGDHCDNFYRLNWKKYTYAICFVCERAILFVANGSSTTECLGQDGDDRTTDIHIVRCSRCGCASRSSTDEEENMAVNMLSRGNHITSLIVLMSPCLPIFIYGDGKTHPMETGQVITDIRKLAATMLPHSFIGSLDTEAGLIKMLEKDFIQL